MTVSSLGLASYRRNLVLSTTPSKERKPGHTELRAKECYRGRRSRRRGRQEIETRQTCPDSRGRAAPESAAVAPFALSFPLAKEVDAARLGVVHVEPKSVVGLVPADPLANEASLPANVISDGCVATQQGRGPATGRIPNASSVGLLRAHLWTQRAHRAVVLRGTKS